MLSVEECKKIIGNTKLSDKKVKNLRDNFYIVADLLFDKFIEQDSECRKINRKS